MDIISKGAKKDQPRNVLIVHASDMTCPAKTDEFESGGRGRGWLLVLRQTSLLVTLSFQIKPMMEHRKHVWNALKPISQLRYIVQHLLIYRRTLKTPAHANFGFYGQIYIYSIGQASKC